jgi:hypothetical protein
VKIGFTGTREGMSETQKRQLAWMLAVFVYADYHVGREVELHHGFAIGADREAEEIATKLNVPKRNIKRYPAGDDPLARDRVLADKVDIMVAAPKTDKEIRRSGTWATIRYTRALGKPVLMLSRGGSRSATDAEAEAAGKVILDKHRGLFERLAKR